MMTCSMVSEPGVSDNTGRYRRHPGVAALARRCIVDNDDERADAVEIVSAIWDLSEQLKEPAGPPPVASVALSVRIVRGHQPVEEFRTVSIGPVPVSMRVSELSR